MTWVPDKKTLLYHYEGVYAEAPETLPGLMETGHLFLEGIELVW
jgi:hypothetical protein